MLRFMLQAADQPPCVVLSVTVDHDHALEPRDERPPLAHRRRGFGHMAEPPEFVPRPGSTLGKCFILALGQSLGLSDKVCQAGLALTCPITVHRVAIGNHNPSPALYQSLERGPGAPGMDHE